MPDAMNGHYESLGRLASAAARMEQVVDVFLRDAITPDSIVGALIVGGMQFDRRVEMLKSVLSVRLPDDEGRARLFTRLSEAKSLMQQRNAFLHGIWAHGPDDTLTVHNRSRNSDIYKARPVADGEVREVAGQLMWMAQHLEWANVMYGDVFGTWEEYDGGMRRVSSRAIGDA